MNHDVVVLRARKGVPGIGRKIARHFGANEVTAGHRPNIKIRDGAVVINYGRSVKPIWMDDLINRGGTLLNNPSAVRDSVDKIRTLRILDMYGVPCLKTTTDPQVVWKSLSSTRRIEWLARTTATGRQGKGIVPIYGGTEYGPEGDIFPDAPLYTEFYDKTHEFRVHVFRGEVIDYVQKKRMGRKKLDALGRDNADMLVRNHKRGWVFAHNDIIRDPIIEQLGVGAAKALGLDYAGIDILAKIEDGVIKDAVVCESNSAPGMSSATTFNAYAQAFANFIKEHHK